MLRILFFAMTLSFTARADVQVRATVDHATVGQGDLLQYQVSVSTDDSVNIEPPPVDRGVNGFEVQGSSTGYETRSSYENGRFLTKQSRVFTYRLLALKKGKYSIPAFEVGVMGKSIKTNPVQVTVTDQRAAPPGGNAQRGGGGDDGDEMEEIFQQMMQRHFGGRPGGGGGGGAGGGAGGMPNAPVNPNEAFLIQAQVDKTKAYVGEQITANFYLLTRGQVRDIDTLRYPDLKGFWKEDLEMATRLNFENVAINGVAYQRALLVSYALFPRKAGTSTVDPYTAKCTVLTPSAFGFGHPYVFTKSSTPIKIEVEDVPTTRPANYTGAVGQFKVRAAFEPATGTVNQPVTLRVRFEGKGNAKLIEMPKLNLPPSFEFYDQKSQAQFAKDGSSFKEFEVLIIPREPGVFKIDPVAIATFDPSTREFAQVASEPLSISVTGSASTPAAPTLPGEKPAAPTPEPTGPVVPDLATELHGFEVPTRVSAGVLGAAYALIFAALGFFGFTRLLGRPKKAGLALVLKRRLEAVRRYQAAKEYRRMGVELTNTAYHILGQLSGQGGAHQELDRLLESTAPSLRNELSVDLRQLLAKCEALSFAPEGAVDELTGSGSLDSLTREFARVMERAIELAEI